MEEIERISMEEVRRLIRRLIEAGYEHRVPTSISAQQIQTAYETTVKNVSSAQDIKDWLSAGTTCLNEHASCVRKHFEELIGFLTPICEALDFHPVNQRRRKALVDCLKRSESNFEVTEGNLQNALREIASQQFCTGTEVQLRENEDLPQLLDSDEEAQLHAELDALVEMQERVVVVGGNRNKYMANVFQSACLQITDIEEMFQTLANVFHAAAMSKELKIVPAVTLEQFSTVLDKLNLSSTSLSELEQMFEQGLHYVPFQKALRVAATGRYDSLSVAEESINEHNSENSKASMTSILIGSEAFRKSLMSLTIDSSLCHLAEAPSLRPLSSAQLRVLSFGGKMRAVAKGDEFLKEFSVNLQSATSRSDHTNKTSIHQVVSEVEERTNVAARAMQNGLFSPCVRTSSLSVSSSQTWFLVISGSLVIDDDPLRLEQKLYSELGPGDIFGGYRALTGFRTPFTVRAVRGCELLELQMSSLLKVCSTESDDIRRFLASSMGEAPLSAAFSPPRVHDRSDFDHNAVADVPIPDMKLQSVKSALSKIEQIWHDICLGEQLVPLSQFTAIQPYLGEVGSELFNKLFMVKGVPEHIEKPVYWEIWLNFLTHASYGGDISEIDGIDDKIQSQAHAPPAIDLTISDKSQRNCLEILQARFSRARRLGNRLFDREVLELYEISFVGVTGAIGAPLQASKVALFLERLFPNFKYQISHYNCNEFLLAFGRDGLETKQISFADIRKVLIERSKETRHNGLFIDSALNRNSNFYTHWINLMCIVACLQFVCVPVRLCFVPWKSMLDTRALALDLTLDFLTAAHVVVLSNTAYQNSRGHWITNRFKMLRKIKVFYLLAAVPVDWFAYVFGASFEMCNWLRLLKLLLPFEILVRERNQGFQMSTLHRLLGLFMISFGLLHVAACAWFYIGTRYKEWHPQAAVSWYEISPSLASLSRISYQDRYGLRNGSTVWDQYLILIPI